MRRLNNQQFQGQRTRACKVFPKSRFSAFGHNSFYSHPCFDTSSTRSLPAGKGMTRFAHIMSSACLSWLGICPHMGLSYLLRHHSSQPHSPLAIDQLSLLALFHPAILALSHPGRYQVLHSFNHLQNPTSVAYGRASYLDRIIS